MKLITYQYPGTPDPSVGILHKDQQRIAPISAAGFKEITMQELILCFGEAEKIRLEQLSQQDDAFTIPMKDVKICAPIPSPAQDIICLGVNYREHAEEAARFKKEAFDIQASYPVYFSKRVNEASGPMQPIPAHEDIVDSLDYEAELAVILGRDARDVKAENAQEYIFGYTILNDVSARNLQTRHSQWYFGKSLEGFAPMGPVIVTADEIPYPPRLSIESLVNGELRQSSNTELLIFDIGYVLEELSRGMTLKTGTIISTGTPKGVGMGFVPPRFLKKGDVVECRIEQIGSLINPVE